LRRTPQRRRCNFSFSLFPAFTNELVDGWHNRCLILYFGLLNYELGKMHVFIQQMDNCQAFCSKR
jgi:hypothetical protein